MTGGGAPTCTVRPNHGRVAVDVRVPIDLDNTKAGDSHTPVEETT